MKKSVLWSLRLGYSTAQAEKIDSLGLEKFLKNAFAVEKNLPTPDFFEDAPKNLKTYREYRRMAKSFSAEEKKADNTKQRETALNLQKWWLERMIHSEYPLIEQMICFWHNHFVATQQKVKVNYWIYQHHNILRQNAFGNFKTLTKQILKSNAMLSYLDNAKNRTQSLNENLSRELLELFTLGIGNYTENDIKNGAKALAGLGYGEEFGVYRRTFENNETITYLGETGVFKADDLVDIIFKQPQIPYLITKKLLQWFIDDNPSEEKVTYLGDYFKSVAFEIQPLLLKMFQTAYDEPHVGVKIKDPLRYILQLKNDLNLTTTKPEHILYFLRQQGMSLFNQPNVKGWDGGKSWLSSQILLQRNQVADLLCAGKLIRDNKMNPKIKPQIDFFKPNMKSQEIIKWLTDHLIFEVSKSMQTDMETILKYDFDASSPNANAAVLRLYNYIIKTPEFQII